MPCSAGIVPGEEGRLHRAGHRGQHGAEGGPAALLGERRAAAACPAAARGVRPDDVEEQHGHGGGARGGGGAVVGGGHGVSLSPRSSSWSRTHATSPAMRRERSSSVRGRAASGSTPPGVGLHLEVVGHGAVAADEGVERGPQCGRAWRCSGGSGSASSGTWKCTRHGTASPSADRPASGSAPRHGVGQVVARVDRRRPDAVRAPGAGSAPRRTRPARARVAGSAGSSACTAAETWALTTGRPAPASRPSAACGSSKPTARWHRSRHTPIRSVSTPARRSTASLAGLDDAAGLGLQPHPDGAAGAATRCPRAPRRAGRGCRRAARVLPLVPGRAPREAAASRRFPGPRRRAAAGRAPRRSRRCSRGAPPATSRGGRRAA